jgi:putative transcriptional regulator
MKSNIGELIKNSPFKRDFIMKQLGVSANTLSNWCNNKNIPSLDKAYRLADILGCKVDDLYDRTDEIE